MRHSIGDITRACLTLRANHGRALVDSAQCLTQVGCSTDEGNREVEFINVIGVVSRGQHFGFINEIHSQRLQHLRLNKMPDARFGHHRNGYCIDDALDHVRIGHPGHTALCANISRHTLQRHHGGGTSVLGDFRLFGGDDVHNHAALQHLSQSSLDAGSTMGGVGAHCGVDLLQLTGYFKPNARRTCSV